jgi:two-component system, NtrC family, response regulator AtoC
MESPWCLQTSSPAWPNFRVADPCEWVDKEAMQTLDMTGLGALVVEDDPLLRRQVASVMEKLGADVSSAADLRQARELAAALEFDVVLLDINLPDGLGFELLRERVFRETTGVIVMTANSNVEGAVEAMKLGAMDYLVKPFNPAELPLVMARARRARQDARREEHRREEGGGDFFFGRALASLREQLSRILAADARVTGPPPPVLIEGETGTGKTAVARWIHQQGPRARQPLVEVNCSALPEALAESELFGHERGAFTDARAMRMGLFEAASGGTLFLDELPSLSAGLQAKVLTAIEDHRVRRVGGNKPIEVDVRLIAATNQDLRALITGGRFREDLFHRLDLFRLRLPPLRERGEDMVRLAEKLLEKLCQRHRLPKRRLSESGVSRLMAHPWPGNVRELAHELERAIVFEESDLIELAHLGPAVPPPPRHEWFNERFTYPEEGFSLEEAILRLINHALNQAGGNVSAAARLLGVPRDYIRYRLERKTDQKTPET